MSRCYARNEQSVVSLSGTCRLTFKTCVVPGPGLASADPVMSVCWDSLYYPSKGFPTFCSEGVGPRSLCRLREGSNSNVVVSSYLFGLFFTRPLDQPRHASISFPIPVESFSSPKFVVKYLYQTTLVLSMPFNARIVPLPRCATRRDLRSSRYTGELQEIEP